jgi:hypothetical protein
MRSNYIIQELNVVLDKEHPHHLIFADTIYHFGLPAGILLVRFEIVVPFGIYNKLGGILI